MAKKSIFLMDIKEAQAALITGDLIDTLVRFNIITSPEKRTNNERLSRALYEGYYSRETTIMAAIRLRKDTSIYVKPTTQDRLGVV